MLHKFTMFTLIFTALFTVSQTCQSAEDTHTNKQHVQQKFDKLEMLLSDKKDPQKAIKVFNSLIAENAVFEVTSENAATPDFSVKTPVKLDKTQYINSFIQGTAFVDNYSIDINVKSVQTGAKGKLVSKTVITERGELKDIRNFSAPGKPFISKTSCDIQHDETEKAMQINGATCHTSVSYESFI